MLLPQIHKKEPPKRATNLGSYGVASTYLGESIQNARFFQISSIFFLFGITRIIIVIIVMVVAVIIIVVIVAVGLLWVGTESHSV